MDGSLRDAVMGGPKRARMAVKDEHVCTTLLYTTVSLCLCNWLVDRDGLVYLATTASPWSEGAR